MGDHLGDNMQTDAAAYLGARSRMTGDFADCIVWGMAAGRNGYGKAGYRGKKWEVHRLSYEAFVGPIADGMHVLHKCDNKLCINPFHLFLGTPADNMADKKSKGRQRRGEGCYNAKLTAEQVASIRKIRRESGLSYSKIGSMFGTSGCNVGQIVRGETWREADEE